MHSNINFNQIKYILIDFDGTLVDTVPLLFDNYIQFLKKYNRDSTLEEFQSLMGPAIEEFIPLLKTRHGLSEKEEDLILAYTADLAEKYRQEAKLIEGSQEFLIFVKSLGFKLALVTSSSYSLIKSCLEELKLEKYFDHLVTGEKVKKTKPDPEIYLLALKMFAAKPEQAISIEDSYNGILASIKANIPTIALKNKHLLQIPPNAILVNSWKELLDLFNNGLIK